MMVARQLLAEIVDAEETGVRHAESCEICMTSRSVAECVVATGIALRSIEALLAAKQWLDSTTPRNSLVPRRAVRSREISSSVT